MAKKVVPLILAGGKGVRFWPLSRDKYPKQFLELDGRKSLLERTYSRVRKIEGATFPYIVAAEELMPLVASHCGDEVDSEHLISEALAKNTAAAIYWSALKIYKREGEVVLAVFPADHQITDDEKFAATMAKAVAVTTENKAITVIGVKPRYIATGFGYVERGKHIEGENLQYYKVRRFVEKPHREKARRYVKKGTYYWNCGIFVLPLPEVFNIYENHLPAFCKTFAAAAKAIDTPQERALAAEAFQEVESLSFDVGILEKEKNLYLVDTTFPWSDVGTYNSLDAILDANEDGNVLSGNTLTAEVKDSVIISERDLVTVIGVRDIVVVQDHGVVLICPRKRLESIKEIVPQLQGENQKYR